MEFGCSVSLFGNYLLIGAKGFNTNKGAVYLYKVEDSTWNKKVSLIASDPGYSDYFGSSVCLNSEYAFVAAVGDDIGGSSGSVYVFKNNGSEWTQQQKINVYSSSVSIYGDYLFIGGSLPSSSYYGLYTNTSSQADKVFIYKNNDTEWFKDSELVSHDLANKDNFGHTVSVYQNYALVGAPGDDDSQDASGSFYLFKRFETGWVQERKFIVEQGKQNDWFGKAVSVYESTFMMGAFCSDSDGGQGLGYSFIYSWE